MLRFKIAFSLFLQNRLLFALPISIHSSLVIFDNYSGVNLEKTLEKWSFSVETWLDSTPIEEGDEGIYFYFNYGKELDFSSRWFLSLIKLRWIFLSFFLIIRTLFQWNNWRFLFFRCGYSTTNHSMCYPFSPIIIVLVRIFLNYYIIKILLTVVL